MNELAKRNRVEDLEAALRTFPGVIFGKAEGNDEAPVRHHFANGVYCREIFLPKYSLCTSKIHRYETVNILMMGKVAVANPAQEDDCYQAPYVWVSPGGSKRAVYALEDSLWITTHPVDKDWDENDLDKIEAVVIADSLEQLELENKS